MSFVDQSFELSREAQDLARELQRLANAADTLGLSVLYGQLSTAAERSRNVSEKIKKLCSDRVQLDLEESQKQAATVLSAALAGVKMSQNNETVSTV